MRLSELIEQLVLIEATLERSEKANGGPTVWIKGGDPRLRVVGVHSKIVWGGAEVELELGLSKDTWGAT